jgi:ABC-type uncharacterized transport system permease subunit
MKYKFRAECSQDAEQFKHENREAISDYEIQKVEGYPDVYVTFDSYLELSEIIELMRDIDDGHVMYQTVKPIEEYTGERNYEL